MKPWSQRMIDSVLGAIVVSIVLHVIYVYTVPAPACKAPAVDSTQPPAGYTGPKGHKRTDV